MAKKALVARLPTTSSTAWIAPPAARNAASKLPEDIVVSASIRTSPCFGVASRIDQGDISRLETRGTLDDCQVETLRRYVVALGGELELVAVFGDKKIILTGSSARDVDPPSSKPLQRTGPRARTRGSRR